MADPFTTLGVAPAFSLDLTQLAQRHRDLSRTLHPDRHAAAPPGERRRALGHAIEVNAAWRTLRDPITRAEALLERLGVPRDERGGPKASPELLMEVMEQREALAEARASGDAERIDALAGAVRQREQETLARLTEAFSRAEGGELDAPRLLSLLGELRFVRRFLDEVGAALDDLS